MWKFSARKVVLGYIGLSCHSSKEVTDQSLRESFEAIKVKWVLKFYLRCYLPFLRQENTAFKAL